MGTSVLGRFGFWSLAVVGHAHRVRPPENPVDDRQLSLTETHVLDLHILQRVGRGTHFPYLLLEKLPAASLEHRKLVLVVVGFVFVIHKRGSPSWRRGLFLLQSLQPGAATLFQLVPQCGNTSRSARARFPDPGERRFHSFSGCVEHFRERL